MVGLWTILGLPDTGRQRQDQDQDTGRPHADPHPPPAAGGSVPTRPWMINETCFWSRSGTDVEGREHLAPPACVVVWLFGCCGKLWSYVLGASRPGPAAGATPPAFSLPRTECRGRRGPGWLVRIRPGRAPQHFHQGPDPCLQSPLDKSLSAKGDPRNHPFASAAAES